MIFDHDADERDPGSEVRDRVVAGGVVADSGTVHAVRVHALTSAQFADRRRRFSSLSRCGGLASTQKNPGVFQGVSAMSASG